MRSPRIPYESEYRLWSAHDAAPQRHWLSRAPRRLALAHVLSVQTLYSLCDVHQALDELSLSYPREVVSSIDSLSDLKLLSALRAEHARMLGHALVALKKASSAAWPTFQEVEEQFGAVANGPADYGWTVETSDGSNSSRIIGTSWHYVLLAFAYGWVQEVHDTLGVTPRHLEPNPTRGDMFLSRVQKYEYTADDIAWTCESRGEEVPSLIRQVFIPEPAEMMVVKVRMAQEFFRAWKAANPGDAVASETLDANAPELRELRWREANLSPAERRIMEVVANAGERLTSDQILGNLERLYGPTSLGTTKVALATLVRHNYLTNRQDVRPKGYGLADWG